MQGLLPGEVNRTLNRNPPKTTKELYRKLQEYVRGEYGDATKLELPMHKLDVKSTRNKNRSYLHDQEVMAINTNSPAQAMEAWMKVVHIQ